MGSLKRVQLNAPSLPSMWGCSGKVLNTMIYSLKRCWVNITPQPIFHSSTIFYFFYSADQRLQNENICYPWFFFEDCSCVLLSSPCCLPAIFTWTPYHTPNLAGLWVTRNSVLPVEGSGKWFELVARLIFHECVAALTHRGQNTETALMNSAGGSLLSGKEIHK